MTLTEPRACSSLRTLNGILAKLEDSQRTKRRRIKDFLLAKDRKDDLSQLRTELDDAFQVFLVRVFPCDC